MSDNLQRQWLVRGLGWPSTWGKGRTTQAALRNSGLPAGDPVHVWLVDPQASIDDQGNLVSSSQVYMGTGEISADRRDLKMNHRTTPGVSVPSEERLPKATDSDQDSSRQPTPPNDSGNQEMTETLKKAAKPFSLAAGEVQKLPAAGSKRRAAYDLLTREEGATYEQVMEATGWNARNAAEGVRLLNKHNGLALSGDAEGVMRVVPCQPAE